MSGAAETLAIVDYGSGNLHSAEKAFARAGASIGVRVVVTDRPEIVAGADRIVLPGVGAFCDCMAGLTAISGMRAALETAVLGKGRPFFGVCVGAQLMARAGTERGGGPGLGWLDGVVDAIRPSDRSIKIPHMGWNRLDLTREHPVTADLGDAPYVYFVHSFHLTSGAPAELLATADYGGPIAAMFGRDNLVGTQFHPEKSQRIGQRLIENFLRWRP